MITVAGGRVTEPHSYEEGAARYLLPAVQNNALWCDTVCRSHGNPGEFLREIWLNRRETPPFYPNAVTLTPGETDLQMRSIKDLLRAGLSGEWGVKDSYCTLDLAPLGFQKVFEGAWIYRKAAVGKLPDLPLVNVHWRRVNTEVELARWEQAWQGGPADELAAGQNRVFLPSLLANEDVAIFAALVDEQIVAGAIATCTGDVVGISNLFLPPAETLRFRTACIVRTHTLFPHLPLVGYEGGPDLEEMLALGFKAVGPVRIWVRTADKPK